MLTLALLAALGTAMLTAPVSLNPISNGTGRISASARLARIPSALAPLTTGSTCSRIMER
jgi:hypothetical protein